MADRVRRLWLHTLYADNAFSGIKAAPTLSRLNRAHPKQNKVIVLDFQNDTETIEQSFADYDRRPSSAK